MPSTRTYSVLRPVSTWISAAAPCSSRWARGTGPSGMWNSCWSPARAPRRPVPQGAVRGGHPLRRLLGGRHPSGVRPPPEPGHPLHPAPAGTGPGDHGDPGRHGGQPGAAHPAEGVRRGRGGGGGRRGDQRAVAWRGVRTQWTRAATEDAAGEPRTNSPGPGPTRARGTAYGSSARPIHPGSSARRTPRAPRASTPPSAHTAAQVVKTGPVPQRAVPQPTAGKVSGATPKPTRVETEVTRPT